jgi:hypothetical protein
VADVGALAWAMDRSASVALRFGAEKRKVAGLLTLWDRCSGLFLVCGVWLPSWKSVSCISEDVIC